MSDDRAHLTPQPPSPSGADDAPSGEGGSTATAPLSPADRAAQGRRKDTNGEGAGEGARIPPGGGGEVAAQAPAVPEREEGQRTICIDLDGVLASYAGWTGEFSPIGEPIPAAREFCAALRERGWRIIIHTCRGNVVEVANWLIEHGIEHDGINCSAHNAPGSSAKPIADVYLDDRALRFEGRFVDILDRLEDGVEPWWQQP